MAYLREKNRCPGCRAADANEAITVIRCRTKNCEAIQEGKVEFCFGCDTSPCGSLKHLDKRYRTKYKTSMIDNLEFIRDNGIDKFLHRQAKEYECPTCGGVVCIHNGRCYDCAPMA